MESRDSAPRPGLAVGFMLVNVLAVSAYGVLFGLTGGAANPVLWVGLWQLGAAVSFWCYLRSVCPPLARPAGLQALLRQVWTERPLRWLLLIYAVSTTDVVLYAAAAGWAHLLVVAVVYDTWPVWTVLLLTKLEGRSLRAGAGRLFVAGGFCGLGSICVVAAQLGGWSELGELGLAAGWRSAVGAGTALVAGVVSAGGIALVRLGQLAAWRGPARSVAAAVGYSGPLDVLCSMQVSLMAKVVTAPLLLGIGWYGGSAGWFSPVGWGNGLAMALCGVQLLACLWSWSRANALASSPMINLVGCFGPAASVLLLWLFGLAEGLAWLALRRRAAVRGG